MSKTSSLNKKKNISNLISGNFSIRPVKIVMNLDIFDNNSISTANE